MSRRFRIRSLFVLLLIFAVAFAAYHAGDVRYRTEQVLVDSLSDELFGLSFERTVPRYARFLPKRIRQRFSTVTRLTITGGDVNEKEGFITETRQFTDDELLTVLKLKHIQHLSLQGTSVTPDILVRLDELPLRSLNLSGMTLSPTTLERFQRANPECRLCLSFSGVSVHYCGPDRIIIQAMEAKRADIEKRLSRALEGVRLAGYTTCNLALSPGFISREKRWLWEPKDADDYRDFIQQVRDTATKLGYDQMTATASQGNHSINYDLKNGKQFTMNQGNIQYLP